MYSHFLGVCMHCMQKSWNGHRKRREAPPPPPLPLSSLVFSKVQCIGFLWKFVEIHLPWWCYYSSINCLIEWDSRLFAGLLWVICDNWGWVWINGKASLHLACLMTQWVGKKQKKNNTSADWSQIVALLMMRLRELAWDVPSDFWTAHFFLLPCNSHGV